jgi:predicted glycosyltransferase
MSSLLRIWFDILTPKQVMFFKPAIDILKEDNHEILSTSREYKEANELARLRQIELKIVGKHGGADRNQKLLQSANRVLKLTDLVSAFEPDVAVSFSSPEACRVAFGLGIRNVGFNDSPHACAVAKLSVPLLDLLLCPWIIPYSSWTRHGIHRRRILRYKGLDPIAWLFRLGKLPSRLRSDRNYGVQKNNITISNGKKTVLIRMEEAQASYIAQNRSGNSTVKMIDRIIGNLSHIANFSILCRYEDQKSQISERYSDRASVISNVVDGLDLISHSDIFVGAGGTMTTEAALLGKPTISIAPVSFSVEKYLVSQGLALRASTPEGLENLVRRFVADRSSGHKQVVKASRIVRKMEDPIARLISLLTRNA